MHGLIKLPRVILAAVLFFASLTPMVVAADVAIPPLKARVTDLTVTLTAEQRAALENKLAAFEQKKGSQLAVLLVPTTQPETIEQYGIRVAGAWKLGRKDVDDGVLLLIAKNDRALRIEVGRGLEGALPDAGGKRIVAETIAPLFKQGDFNGGINAGVDRIIKVLEGEPLPAPAAQRSGGGGYSTNDALTWGGLLVVFLGGFLRWIFGTFLGSLIAGAVAGGAAFYLGAGMTVGAVVGVIVFFASLMGLSFFGGGGGRSSSGSWGGGGGTFGGGGASGRW